MCRKKLWPWQGLKGGKLELISAGITYIVLSNNKIHQLANTYMMWLFYEHIFVA